MDYLRCLGITTATWARGVSARAGSRPSPLLVAVLIVAGMANPEFLLEIEAIAVVSDNDG
jgi:hypothetical protein